MSEKEKKSRFEVSREVQEEFVNGIAETMLTLAEKAGEWQKGWAADTPLGMPFCVATGREYTGANMVRLLMASMVNDYSDDRWVTFKQLQEIQAKNPEQEMRIRKGEHGVKILRPEEIFFTIDEDGRWNFLSAKEIKKLREAKANGEEVPEVKRKTLFYPFTVFNAAQIDGFPAKEKVKAPMTEIERNFSMPPAMRAAKTAKRKRSKPSRAMPLRKCGPRCSPCWPEPCFIFPCRKEIRRPI